MLSQLSYSPTTGKGTAGYDTRPARVSTKIGRSFAPAKRRSTLTQDLHDLREALGVRAPDGGPWETALESVLG